MKQLTTEKVVSDFKTIHGDTYDYSKVVYTKSSEKVIIGCKLHGDFMQTPNKHKNGRGCRLCNGGSQLTNAEFIVRAAAVHNYKYLYYKTMYTSMRDTVIITCPQHGDFEILAEMHTNKARGCKKCSGRYRMTEEEFTAEAAKVHGNRYDYSLVDYKTSETHVNIQCEVHGIFEQTPYKHLTGQGCPACNHGGFASNKPGTLYYLKINNGEAYKIGITNKSVELRFTPTELKTIEVIHTWHYKNGKDCYMQEQDILKKYVKYKYTGPDLLVSGNTELFNCDVLALDKESANEIPMY